jgi:hypothetical protein
VDRWLRSFALILVCTATHAAGAQGRGRPELVLALPAPAALASDGPTMTASHIISDPNMQDLPRNGFPAHLHYRVELWNSGGFIDDLRRGIEWDVIVRYDAFSARYRVARIISDRVESIGQYAKFADAVAEVERPFKVPIVPNKESGRQYYAASLEVETMSMNDLDEVERWLRGEMKPAVRGKSNPGTAVGRGVGKVLTRLLGGERRNLKARSGTFRVS